MRRETCSRLHFYLLVTQIHVNGMLVRSEALSRAFNFSKAKQFNNYCAYTRAGNASASFSLVLHAEIKAF